MTPEQIMRRVLRLAKKGLGRVSPNPMVGALVVQDGHILAQGYHQAWGQAHAEADALSKLSVEQSRGADLYVNLEPCNHHGKTPPCTERILQAQIARVVVGMADPNPLVQGGGIERLRREGVEVIFGLLEEKCRWLNRGFISAVTRNRPWVTLKIAQTLDGKIALPDGASQWITGPEARKDVHRLRRDHDAVLTGIGTVLADDCGLDVRLVKGVSPKRIVLDSRLRIPPQARILNHPDPERTFLACGEDAAPDRIQSLKERGHAVWTLPSDKNGIHPAALLAQAHEAQIQSLLIEAGPRVATSFLKAGLVDHLVVYTAPKLFGEGLPPLGNLGVADPNLAIEVEGFSIKKIGVDYRFEGRPVVHRTR